MTLLSIMSVNMGILILYKKLSIYKSLFQFYNNRDKLYFGSPVCHKIKYLLKKNQ